MGLILGRITVETPKFEVVGAAADYEIRRYAPSVVAEVTYDPDQPGVGPDAGFMILANYIGAVGQPQNSRPEKIAMTAPVVTSALSGAGVTMRFVLPAKYARAEDAPRPTDQRVRITEEGERKYGVLRFSGVATPAAAAERAERLRRSLERDGYTVIGDFVLARYNPPWTLPPFRTNEKRDLLNPRADAGPPTPSSVACVAAATHSAEDEARSGVVGEQKKRIVV